MLTFTPHLAMLASLLAVTILPASTIAAAAVEAKGFNPLNSISGHRLGGLGGKRQMFERDEIDEQSGVPGTIDIQLSGWLCYIPLSQHQYFDSGRIVHGRDALDHGSVYRVPSICVECGSGGRVSLHVADFPASGLCVTASLVKAQPFTVERCSNSKDANAHKTQVFRYNKQTGVIQALRPTGSTPSGDALTGPYRGRTLTFVPGVAKTEDGKDSSSSTANTATEAEAEAETGAQSGSSSSTQ
ncbi:uncharacterized protein LACBIDRAFT_321488 [Laccaria bicolor S238N-H82]|uniref:Predicted protein n=1 Tax=Laccaria bicolor (strain S238N-H82 / ATCC MYA-4686) TaxID=486041 RepID=B0CT26_LACBS|nr:uncharacterized protein LACBIDRAFT_321488 [Laccaria bicolor S238N-H82]EDR13866.1 predicted protein [Laccaria bicolor S238N-H82]|eukprot:XP_001874425.1 predicted protein [Laccaria bicolor S238N-H82]